MNDLPLDLDHLRYLRNRTYRRRVQARLRRLVAQQPGAINSLAVIHELDQRCCRREQWPVTYRSLLAALVSDGERVLGIAL